MAQVMNLRRFRRKGLAKVRLEFSIHAAAYNLGRALAALCGGSFVLSRLWRAWTRCAIQPNTLAAMPLALLREARCAVHV